MRGAPHSGHGHNGSRGRGTGKRRTLRRADLIALRDDLEAKAGILDIAAREAEPWGIDKGTLATVRAYREVADMLGRLLGDL